MKPSLRAILWNDWPSLASWTGLLIIWALSYGYHLLGRAPDDVLGLWLPIAATFVLFAVLAWRIWRIFSLFSSGIEVPGHIIQLWITRDRGRLEFGYRIDGQASISWMPVHKTSRVLAFTEGQAIHVLVRATAPSHAIVKELYI